MGTGDTILDLERLYDVVLAPECWPELLHDIARSTNAVGACLAAGLGSKTLIARPVSPDLIDPIDDFMKNGWYQRDLRGFRAWPLFREGRKLLVEHDVSTEDERRRSAYHNEWLGPWDLPWWGALGFSLEDQHYGLVVLRNARQGAVTPEDMRPLLALRPHLNRVFALIDLLSMKRAEAVLDAMDLIEKPAFLLNAAGRVIRFNTRAGGLLDRHLRLVHGVLRAVHADGSDGLEKLIATVLSPGFSLSGSQPHWTTVRRLDGHPLVVSALPIIGSLSDVLTGARALLIVNDLGAKRLPPRTSCASSSA